MRRAQSWWNEDADAMEATAQNYQGDIKIQICGPWTLSAHIEMSNGERMIRDAGACREIAEALALTVRSLVESTRIRVPNAQAIYVQCDEPSMAAVAEGSLRTASGYGRHSPVVDGVLETHLRLVMESISQVGGIPGIHACSSRVPWRVVRKSGAKFISFDALTGVPDDDYLGSMWEAGITLFFGSVPALPAEGEWNGITASAPARMAAHRLGISDFHNVVITPTCGLAGATPEWVRTAYGACREAATILQGESDVEEA
jgi:methionine synthase II (cobalamin-independent)